MPTPAVAIVVPLFNDAPTIQACVRSVLTNTRYPDWKLIVVDDGSTDQGWALLQEFIGVKVIRQARRGAAGAVNTGIADAGGCDIVRLHADVVIDTADWLERMVEAAYADPLTGIVGARLVYPDGRIHSEGHSIITSLGMHPQHYARRAFQPDGAPGKLQEVDSVPGALAYYRREVLDHVGGFDENYGPAWTDDDDFCIAARRAGFKVYVHAGVNAVHYTRAQSPMHRVFIPESESEIAKLTGFVKTVCKRRQMDYWVKKWGWHPAYPDLGEIRRLYGDTEICWQIGEVLRYHPKSETPVVDCCIVTYNTLPLLQRCLESLALTDYPTDCINVYVVDNASTDGTASYLAELAKTYPIKLYHLRLEVNTGCPVGLNFAVAAGKGELVARLDDDIVLPTDWIKLMVGDLRARPFAGCVGAKIINDDDHKTIQCGPYRHHPGIYGHEDEYDHGQADYLSRASHVRGCCNLYRRDALRRSGPFDSRFSPTQFDDPDHHLAVLYAGYEIIYDGRVRVVHKLNSGLGRTSAAISNQKANHNKMFGKWGADVWEVVERSIDLSREGRYLPDDGDTSSWIALGPEPKLYPRKVNERLDIPKSVITEHYDELNRAFTSAEVSCWLDEYVALGVFTRENRGIRFSVEILHNAINLGPTRIDAIAALAETYVTLGQSALGHTLAKRGLALAPDNARLLTIQHATTRAPALPNSLQRVNEIGDTDAQMSQVASKGSNGTGLRVLMVNTYEQRSAGGDMHQIKKTKQYLEKLGHQVDINCTPRPDPRGYDVVHLWNSWFPAQTLVQVKAIRAWRPEMPIVHTPIFWDMREKCWADAAVPQIFSKTANPAHLKEKLAALANGTYAHQGRTRSKPRESNWLGYDTYQKAIFPLVDYLLPQSHAEVANLKKIHGIDMPFNIVRNGAETAVFDQATPDWFFSQYGLKNFVITVGLVEPRKNQLMLLHALRDSNLSIVVIGRHYDVDYYRLCRRYAPKGTLFIDHLPHEHLASAFKAAKVHALPSWMECASFANVEAALCGCALAVSDRTSEKEYFGTNAYYCDPGNLTAIREAVLQAHRNHTADAPKRARLIEQFRNHFTWQNAATATVTGYDAALARRRQRVTANSV
jgi:GT2 family glycosyltransferase/glycosyltransferase involved in cell wall biosynthesis